MAGQELVSRFLALILCSITGLVLAVSPALPPYLPTPGPAMHGSPLMPCSPGLLPIPYPVEPISPALPYLPVPVPATPQVPNSPGLQPFPYSPRSPPEIPDTPEPAWPTSAPPEAGTPAQTPFPYPPESPSPCPVSYPPLSASPMPSPVGPSDPSKPIYYPPEPSPMPAPISPKWPSKGVKGAYWPSFNSFPVSAIDTSFFTHIYYAFLLPDSVTYTLAITPSDEAMLPSFTSTLRAQNSYVMTLLSIGGAGNDPKVFSAIASNSSNRAIFIESTIEIARQYGFDGLDLDWEFPLDQEDMSNLGILYKEWRKALKKEAKATGRTHLLLTAAVYYASTVPLDGVTRSYPGESIRKHLDWVSPMCFDYYGSWEMITGPPSALYNPNSTLSTAYGVQSWLDAGVPARKIVMGLPVYGHSWKLEDPNVHGIGSPAVSIGPGDQGFMAYTEVVDFNNENNATLVYDRPTSSMYSYAGDIWIGYDNPMSIKKKVRFARYRGLRGYFFWALGQDKDWTISRQASNAWGN